MDFRIPVGKWIDWLVEYLLDHFESVFDALALAIGVVANGIEAALQSVPVVVLVAIFVLLGLWRVGWRFAVFVAVALILVLGMDLWHQTVSTLALVLSATLVSLLVGIPLGILAAKSDAADTLIRPILDLMQTMPAFVYLIPAAMFFGLGKVPGIIATIIFAMPPSVRLTNLGIRQVPREMVEAGSAFGCTPLQLLGKVEIPTAMPSIMAGINQTIMLALSMVVIASMIGAGGLGNDVLQGIQRLDVGLGFEGGLGVVILAIILDRISQSFASKEKSPFGAALKALLHQKGRAAGKT